MTGNKMGNTLLLKYTGVITSILPYQGKYEIKIRTERDEPIRIMVDTRRLLEMWEALGNRVTGTYTLEKLSSAVVNNKELKGLLYFE